MLGNYKKQEHTPMVTQVVLKIHANKTQKTQRAKYDI
jgi:hypothetical protein